MKNKNNKNFSGLILTSMLAVYSMNIAILAFMRCFEDKIKLDLIQFKGTSFYSLLFAGLICSIFISLYFFAKARFASKPIINVFMGILALGMPMLFINTNAYSLILADHINIKLFMMFLCVTVIIREFINQSSPQKIEVAHA